MTWRAISARPDLQESYILGRAAPSQRSPLADSSSDGVDAQWPQSRGIGAADDAGEDASSTDKGASFDGAKFKEVLLVGSSIHYRPSHQHTF
jgi:hypothetical protein